MHREQCSCSAVIHVRGGRRRIERRVADWRATHRHEFAPVAVGRESESFSVVETNVPQILGFRPNEHTVPPAPEERAR